MGGCPAAATPGPRHTKRGPVEGLRLRAPTGRLLPETERCEMKDFSSSKASVVSLTFVLFLLISVKLKQMPDKHDCTITMSVVGAVCVRFVLNLSIIMQSVVLFGAKQLHLT